MYIFLRTFLLSVSKGIVDVHGGSLSVFSDGEGCGSTFTLQLNIDESRSAGGINPQKHSRTNSIQKVLPASMDRASNAYQVRSKSSLINVTQFEQKDNDTTDNVYEWKDDDVCPPTTRLEMDYNSKYSILIVDDSAPTRSILSKLLLPRCRKLDQAGDGLQALRMVEVSKDAGDPYDVIFMDSEMPNMNGPTAARQIREQLGYQGMIIGVTGNALPDDIANFKYHGADDVLVKPLKTSQLDVVLQRARRNSLDISRHV